MRGSTVPTVKTQLSQIFRKSALENRYQLIAFVTDEVCVMAGQADNQAEQSQKASAKTPIVVPMVRKGKPAVPQIFLKRKLSNG